MLILIELILEARHDINFCTKNSYVLSTDTFSSCSPRYRDDLKDVSVGGVAFVNKVDVPVVHIGISSCLYKVSEVVLSLIVSIALRSFNFDTLYVY